LGDPEYIGWRHERMTGQAYFDFVDQFVRAVVQELPSTCLQWEDFATPHARPILERYRDQLLTFNDDIQGTAAVALGAILGAVKVTAACTTKAATVDGPIYIAEAATPRVLGGSCGRRPLLVIAGVRGRVATIGVLAPVTFFTYAAFGVVALVFIMNEGAGD